MGTDRSDAWEDLVKMRVKLVMAVATVGVILAMVGSASASSVCVNLNLSAQGHTVSVNRCVTH